MKKLSTEKQRKLNAGSGGMWCTKCHKKLANDLWCADGSFHWCCVRIGWPF